MTSSDQKYDDLVTKRPLTCDFEVIQLTESLATVSLELNPAHFYFDGTVSPDVITDLSDLYNRILLSGRGMDTTASHPLSITLTRMRGGGSASSLKAVSAITEPGNDATQSYLSVHSKIFEDEDESPFALVEAVYG